MADTISSLFGIHAAALGLREARLDVLASNLANADTPNYKARDIDFAQALAAATAPAAPFTPAGANVTGTTASTTASAGDDKTSVSLPAAPDLSSVTRYRVPLQPSLDGNTVDGDVEHAAFARAALEYKASLSFIDARVRTLMTAITGE